MAAEIVIERCDLDINLFDSRSFQRV